MNGHESIATAEQEAEAQAHRDGVKKRAELLATAWVNMIALVPHYTFAEVFFAIAMLNHDTVNRLCSTKEPAAYADAVAYLENLKLNCDNLIAGCNTALQNIAAANSNAESATQDASA